MPYLKGLQWNPDSLFGRLARYVSLTSYSMYLSHFSIALLVHAYMLPSTLLEGYLVFAVYLGGTIIVSSVQYKLVETPFMRMRDRKWREPSVQTS
jgi:peptidoglycan/LPS O-acetylase OafA/YrhL